MLVCPDMTCEEVQHVLGKFKFIFREIGGVGSGPACCGSTLGSNPDTSQKKKKWATLAKEWTTHSSSPKKTNKKFGIVVSDLGLIGFFNPQS